MNYFFITTLLILIACNPNYDLDEKILENSDIKYEHPVVVQIQGYAQDAMEPFISPDGNYLFFNNKNDGINTKLYYAEKITDSTFNYLGELIGVNQTTPPFLDAVADLDANHNFYWTSTRGYPNAFDNLHHGTFQSGQVVDIGRLHGDFYIYSPGWIIMDHGISYDGGYLFFNNALFNDPDCAGPCETNIGVAKKVNDSTFITLANSAKIMELVNDVKFKNYAPSITRDNLELYFTRIPQGKINGNSEAEICVAVRQSSNDVFSPPTVLFKDIILTDMIEAPTLTTDKKVMYYHKGINGVFRIMMRTRQ